ncbi:DNA polymerase III subunit gamma/tau [Shewanella cyperi]|uniref:DNA polymerase III subunit gamma/tau n=1 Tax=Shewanella cyperi TaxID=2814292 RepID=UPI001A93CA7E|nr:DNA polymerase III subunit gamma/tau [Shewanella cyperi]QSX42094.1 DNA polymerase III subunit gamma/tau [Shewanella cyperi]
MSYQVLARKWRPAKFEQVVGQSHVLHALTNALGQNRLHHAYLFTGTRGVGKTSLARLFAKGLNCEQGITASPCGVCASCVEIAQGRFVDLIEVDAASRTKVDDTREILDNVQYRPSRGRFKVYLIDEVHMLSKSSFNALLKTLEEPPEHVKFLLATTDPQKLPVTVLSRCLQFNLKSLSKEQISQQLALILKAEGLPFEAPALELLAKAAQGSMRDALSLTDQAIAFGAGQVLREQVQTMLGSVDTGQVINLLQTLAQAEIAPLMQAASSALAFGADADELLRSLLELLHQISLSQFAPAAAELSEHSEQVLAFAKALAPEQVQLYYQILLEGRKELPFAPDPRTGLEMTLLRAVAFIPQMPAKRWQKGEGVALDIPAAPKVVSAAPVVATPTPPVATPASVEAQTDQGAITPAPQADVTDSHDSAPAPGQSSQADMPELDSGLWEDMDEANAALVAEQNLLLSQAESQGFAGEDMFGFVPDEAPQEQLMPMPVTQAQQQVPDLDAPQATVPLALGDDILDAVLAARDDLLSQLGSDVAEEGDPKKSWQPLSRQREVVEAKSNSAESVIAQDEPQLAAPAPTMAPTPAVTAPADEDRPPWEEAAKPVVDAAAETSLPAEAEAEVKAGAAIEPHLPAPQPEVPLPAEQQPEATQAETKQTDAKQTAEKAQDGPGLPAIPETASGIVNLSVPADLGDITGHQDDLRWYKLMSALDIGGRVRQLAVNSVCLDWSEPLQLVLKPDQKHLAAPIAITQLVESLGRALGHATEVQVDVGQVVGRETPLEIRQRFHQELLGQAQASLLADPNVNWLMTWAGAELQPDSLNYPGELLGARGRALPALPPLQQPQEA